MNLSDAFEISGDVVSREVGGETVLLDLASGTYFGLDEIGAQIWQVLEDGGSAAQACEAVLASYDVERDVLERDALALLGQLMERGLISAA